MPDDLVILWRFQGSASYTTGTALRVHTALHTGSRKSALLSLTWDDVDFQRRIMTVQGAYAKNGEARSVPMHDVLTITLKALRMIGRQMGWCFVAATARPIIEKSTRPLSSAG